MLDVSKMAKKWSNRKTVNAKMPTQTRSRTGLRVPRATSLFSTPTTTRQSTTTATRAATDDERLRNSVAFLCYRYLIGGERQSLLFWLYNLVYSSLASMRRLAGAARPDTADSVRADHQRRARRRSAAADSDASARRARRRAAIDKYLSVNGEIEMTRDVLSPLATPERGIASLGSLLDGSDSPSTPRSGTTRLSLPRTPRGTIVTAGGLEDDEVSVELIDEDELVAKCQRCPTLLDVALRFPNTV